MQLIRLKTTLNFFHDTLCNYDSVAPQPVPSLGTVPFLGFIYNSRPRTFFGFAFLLESLTGAA